MAVDPINLQHGVVKDQGFSAKDGSRASLGLVKMAERLVSYDEIGSSRPQSYVSRELSAQPVRDVYVAVRSGHRYASNGHSIR